MIRFVIGIISVDIILIISEVIIIIGVVVVVAFLNVVPLLIDSNTSQTNLSVSQK